MNWTPVILIALLVAMLVGFKILHRLKDDA
jgi:hypothetical protein